MPNIRIIDSTYSHVKQLRRTLRENDKKEAIALGLDPEKAVFDAYRKGLYRRTALVDGEVAAMWGVAGTPMGVFGQPYLMTGTASELIPPIRFAKIYRSQLKTMEGLFPVLENYVDASYVGAVRMLQIAGFTLSDPINYNGNLFYRFTKVS